MEILVRTHQRTFGPEDEDSPAQYQGVAPFAVVQCLGPHADDYSKGDGRTRYGAP
jgi:hypothetical protein